MVRGCTNCGMPIKDEGTHNKDPWWMLKPQWLKDIEGYKELRNGEKIRITRMTKALQRRISVSPRSEAGRAMAKEILYLGKRYNLGVFGPGGRKPCSAKYDIDKYPWEQSISFKDYWERMVPYWWDNSWVPEGFWVKWKETPEHYVELVKERAKFQ